MKENLTKRVRSIDAFYVLKKGCSVFKPENIERNIGMEYKIWSPFSQTWYSNKITADTDMDLLAAYCRDGNLYKAEDV